MSSRLISRLCPRCQLQRSRGQQPLGSLPSSSGMMATLPSRTASASTSTTLAYVRAFSISRTLALPAPARPPTSTPAPSAPPKTHYDLFPLTLTSGPPPHGPFNIDTRALRAEFRQRQAKIHPDMQPANLRPAAEAESSQLNEAFRTLADPLHRAQYLLRLRGIDLANDEAARADDGEMLMQVMDAHEAIEDAVEEEDLDETRAVNDARIDASVKVLAEAFASEDIERAKREAARLKYWANIADALQNWEKGKRSVLMH